MAQNNDIDKRLEEIRERLDRTTTGGWRYIESDNVVITTDNDYKYAAEIAEEISFVPDGEFIAHAHDDIIFILTQLKIEQEEKGRLRSELKQCYECNNAFSAEYYDDLLPKLKQYEKALKEITEVGWSSSFGGGYNYMGEHHAKCIEIARSTLGGDRE